MATLEQKINAEQKLREMVESEGLPDPDHIEYGYTCIRAIWIESKVALVIDIDDLGPEVESLEDLGLDPTELDADHRTEPDLNHGMPFDKDGGSGRSLHGGDEPADIGGRL